MIVRRSESMASSQEVGPFPAVPQTTSVRERIGKSPLGEEKEKNQDGARRSEQCSEQ